MARAARGPFFWTDLFAPVVRRHPRSLAIWCRASHCFRLILRSNMRRQKIEELEREVLRSLCGMASVRDAQRYAAQLENHPWADSECRIVYEALMRTVAREIKAWRNELPAEATRMGFPDVEWENYFTSKRTRRDQLETRIVSLRTISSLGP
jgi:hypothetical protein